MSLGVVGLNLPGGRFSTALNVLENPIATFQRFAENLFKSDRRFLDLGYLVIPVIYDWMSNSPLCSENKVVAIGIGGYLE
jgi:hypothetical protein